jgi:hypothetical protein
VLTILCRRHGERSFPKIPVLKNQNCPTLDLSDAPRGFAGFYGRNFWVPVNSVTITVIGS